MYCFYLKISVSKPFLHFKENGRGAKETKGDIVRRAAEQQTGHTCSHVRVPGTQPKLYSPIGHAVQVCTSQSIVKMVLKLSF